jgi:hypothetical protein
MSYEARGFLNVDLELTAAHGLEALVHALTKEGMHCLNVEPVSSNDQWTGTFAGLELNPPPSSIEVVLQRILVVVSKLSPEMRKLWNGCETRVLNAGFEGPSKFPGDAYKIPARLLMEMAQHNLDLEVTIYPGEEAASA